MRIQWLYFAIISELGLVFSPFVKTPNLEALVALLVVHVFTSGMMAIIALPLLPKAYRQQKAWAMALLFSLGFLAPLIAPAITIILIRYSEFLKRFLRIQDIRIANPIEYNIDATKYNMDDGERHKAPRGTIRTRLTPHMPETVRLQAVLSLQDMPGYIANPILEELFSDENDDIRLLAFGIRDSKEKALAQNIHNELKRLATVSSQIKKNKCHKHIAELYWELVYSSLVQGELKSHILETALDYVNEACTHTPGADDPGLALLRGRILLALNKTAEAEAEFIRSLNLGQAPASVLPYLAEVAYSKKDYKAVHRLLAGLSTQPLNIRLRSLCDLWANPQQAKRIHQSPVLIDSYL